MCQNQPSDQPSDQPSEFAAPLQLPHSPEECADYCAAHCVKNHQDNPAYRQACLDAAAKAYEDAEADHKAGNEAFEQAEAQGFAAMATRGKENEAAMEAMLAALTFGEECAKRLDKNKKIVAAVEKAYSVDVKGERGFDYKALCFLQDIIVDTMLLCILCPQLYYYIKPLSPSSIPIILTMLQLRTFLFLTSFIYLIMLHLLILFFLVLAFYTYIYNSVIRLYTHDSRAKLLFPLSTKA
ncbi:hypothetical protein MMC18_000132 [Xylographa bjoerkii]|nr:hypothetical protein [Xylographa bjoerkii]